MRISRVEIENFRSIRRIELNVPQICVLVGPNNSGKSNVLAAIARVLGRDWVSVSSFDEDDVHCRHPEAAVRIAQLSFEFTRYKIGENKGQRRLDQRCLDSSRQTVSVLAKTPRAGEKHRYEPLVGIPREIQEDIPLIFIGANRSLKEQLPLSRSGARR